MSLVFRREWCTFQYATKRSMETWGDESVTKSSFFTLVQ